MTIVWVRDGRRTLETRATRNILIASYLLDLYRISLQLDRALKIYHPIITLPKELKFLIRYVYLSESNS